MQKHIIFTGGGTGGHVYPAIAIVKQLINEGYKITWIGSKKGIEYSIVSTLGINFFSIPSGKLRRYFSFRNFLDIFKILSGFLKSLYILNKVRPSLVFSKGGYVTVPVIIASRLLKLKSFTHESDFDPGLATRINSRFVNKIFIPYKESRRFFSKYDNKVVVTGNPVRQEFYNPDKKTGKEVMGFGNKKPTVLVLGGSLGAKEINDLIEDNIDDILVKYNVYHQMGPSNFKKSEKKGYKTVSYINENMADLIKASDVVISRSGAGAIWEIGTVGTPSLLIPFRVGSRGDQIRNADYFCSLGISIHYKGEGLLESLNSLMDKNVENNFIKINASREIAGIIKESI